MELKEGAVIADRFRLIRQLGKGGMGEVWAAQHISLDIPCAVKFIHAESAEKEDVRGRFELEAKAAAQLRTPNVVQILDYGVFENTPYIAMEYLDGEPLNARLQRRQRLDPLETFRIITGVGKALSKAHAAGIVHRDLKPENIFLVPDEDAETAKVLDFGVAKSTTTLDSNTRTGALLGTPYYMSPEQAQGTRAVDHRADLWSLAVMTFRCITGELPFKSHALGDLLIKIVTHPIPMPSHIAPNVPEGFDAWWQRAAQRDPAHRFQSAKELVEALGLALNVTAPSQLGMTPMPGTSSARRQPPPGGQTMIADPVTGPSLPFAMHQSGASQQGARHQPTQPLPAYQSGAYGAMATGATANDAPSYPHHAYPLGDSNAAGSVAGIAAPPPARANRSGGKALAIAAAAVVMIGGVIAGVMLLRGSPAAETQVAAPPASVETSAEVAAPSAEPEASEEPAAAASAPPVESASASSQVDLDEPPAVAARSKAPKPKPKAEPVAPPPPGNTGPPTALDLPKPTTPKPAKTYDPGF